jgi:hypothetical protein
VIGLIQAECSHIDSLGLCTALARALINLGPFLSLPALSSGSPQTLNIFLPIHDDEYKLFTSLTVCFKTKYQRSF